MNERYINISHAGRIGEVSYSQLVWRFADVATIPRGADPRFHVREETWFKVAGDFFETEETALIIATSVGSATGGRFAIEEVLRFEGWYWGHEGNSPERIAVFNTKKEADDWLFTRVQLDIAAPIFKTQAEAEEWMDAELKTVQALVAALLQHRRRVRGGASGGAAAANSATGGGSGTKGYAGGAGSR